MPALTEGKVLVTGANGYVAAWVIQDLLEHGFSVRGTVRSESKAGYLRERFKAYGDKLEIVVVSDITAKGAFDVPSTGVDAVMHIASPVNLQAEDPDEVIIPAVKGTESVLGSALKHRTSIKRILIMSSCAAVMIPPPPGQTNFVRELDEGDWNVFSLVQVREKGKDAEGVNKYRAAKTLAERAAWELYEREKASESDLGWDLVVINAPYVFGPFINEAPTLEEFGPGTARDWYNRVVVGDWQNDKEKLTKNGLEYVDVRDLARAHVLGLTVPEASGQRFIIRGGSFVWQQFIDVARQVTDKIPPGEPNYNLEEAVYPVRYSVSKSKQVLGMTYRTLEETTKDTLEDLHRRGWV